MKPHLSLLERAKNARRYRKSKKQFQTKLNDDDGRESVIEAAERGRSMASKEDDSCEYALHHDDGFDDERNPNRVRGGNGQQRSSTRSLRSNEDDSAGTGEENEAHLKQTYSPFSNFFAYTQIIVLGLMLWQCGVAPFNINPMIGPYPDALNYWGAKNAVLIIEDGEIFRLVTPIFLHAGLIHLVGNVMVQFEAGNRWEREWGSLVWMLVYIGSGIGSSILSVCAMPDQISVGSSGAVMGLFGAKMAEIFLLCLEKGETAAQKAGEKSRKEQACGVIIGVVAVMAMSFIPYVDWAAHLGGLVAGFAIGMVCFSFAIRSWAFMLLWFVAGVCTTFALFSGAIAYMYTEVEPPEDLRDVCGYYQQYFEDYECQCMLDEAIQWGSWSGNGDNGNG